MVQEAVVLVVSVQRIEDVPIPAIALIVMVRQLCAMGVRWTE